MTGPEHYREAERLMAEISPEWQAEPITVNTRKAQVHAILALAAAAAVKTEHDQKAWIDAAATKHGVGTPQARGTTKQPPVRTVRRQHPDPGH